MAEEIERKFLLDRTKWIPGTQKSIIRQGYLQDDPERSIRIRISDDSACITIKGKVRGITRKEFTYPVPVDEARELLKLAKNKPIEKIRYAMHFANKCWEVDEFSGTNKGLYLAEVELDSPDEIIELPPWVGKEVSGDLRFYNTYLSSHPYTSWEKEYQTQ
jgi:adenylate cyclase